MADLAVHSLQTTDELLTKNVYGVIMYHTYTKYNIFFTRNKKNEKSTTNQLYKEVFRSLTSHFNYINLYHSITGPRRDFLVRNPV